MDTDLNASSAICRRHDLGQMNFFKLQFLQIKFEDDKPYILVNTA